MSAAANGNLAIQFDRQVYEDPFIDMASTMLPKSYRKLQELCQIFATQHPQIAPVIWRLAEYAITSIVYDGGANGEEAVRRNKEVFEDKLQILDRGLEWGLDYYTYGNAFVTVSFPFERYYICQVCKNRRRAKDTPYKLRGNVFEAVCPSKECVGHSRVHKPFDDYIPRAEGTHILRLEPMLITPKYNRATGATWYYYDIPADLKAAIKGGDRDIIDTTPVDYIDSVFRNTKLKLKPDRVFHFKRPSISGRDMQWGMPLMMPVLKDAYLNQIFKKSDEMVASEHSVPLRILFPEPGSQDPLKKLSLGTFRQFMGRSLQDWRRDRNSIITAPIPVGVKVIGGDQGAYQTIQQRQFIVEEILGGMLVTKGFVMGGEQWSSAGISQRIMENSFTNYLRRFDVCLQWVADLIQRNLGLPACKLSMKSFKKVDDVQQVQMIIQLARENKVSWEEALSRMDIDSSSELKRIEQEFPKHLKLMMDQLVSQAQAGAKSSMIQAQAQEDVQGAQQIMEEQRVKALQAAGIDVAGANGPGQDGQAGEDPGNAGEQAEPGQPQQGGQAPANRQLPPSSAARGQQQQQAQPQERQRPEGQPQGDGVVPTRINMGHQVDSWANELLSLDEKSQRELLTRMRDEDPEFGRTVAGRATEIMFDRQATDIVRESKGPEEIANRLSMMPAKQSLNMAQAIQRQNPHLGMRVMAELAVINRGMVGFAGKPKGDGVDMRPMPEKLPPRRANSIVGGVSNG